MSLVDFFKDKIVLPELGVLLGKGTQGYVYEMKDEPDKVIKLSTLDIYKNESHDLREKKKSSFLTVMGYLQRNYFSCFPKVYDFGVFEGELDNNVLFSFSILEKLKEISCEEKWFFTNLSRFIRNRDSNTEYIKTKIKFYAESEKLIINESAMLDFYLKLICAPINHNDLTGCNFMSNNFGEYKVIDFDRATFMNNE